MKKAVYAVMRETLGHLTMETQVFTTAAAAQQWIDWQRKIGVVAAFRIMRCERTHARKQLQEHSRWD